MEAIREFLSSIFYFFLTPDVTVETHGPLSWRELFHLLLFAGYIAFILAMHAHLN